MQNDGSGSDSEAEIDYMFRFFATSAVQLIGQASTSNAQPQPQTRRVIYREREEANERLVRDYFSENPTYQEDGFRRRFRMSSGMFTRIMNDLQNSTPYFTQRFDARGRKGFSPLQKCTSAIRQLAYGAVPDSLDEYLQMSERTSRDVLQKYCKWVIKLYAWEYLRRPTAADIQKIYEHHESTHGFPGMLGSIDCTHWDWQQCPTAWRGYYTRGDHGVPTVILEAVASQDLWFWHAYFGTPGSNNDINVLQRSTIFDEVSTGRAPLCPFQVNGVQYRYGYYLADGIYPEWATFVKSFPYPQDPKRIKFKTAQEAARKDVERAFGVLKGRWSILRAPARQYETKSMCRIMYACIILYNMILQDEGHAICTFDENDLPTVPATNVNTDAIMREIHSRETHANLLADLVEHIDRVRSDVGDQ